MSDMGYQIGRLFLYLAGGELAVRAERYGVAEAGGEGGPPVCEALAAPLMLIEIPL